MPFHRVLHHFEERLGEQVHVLALVQLCRLLVPLLLLFLFRLAVVVVITSSLAVVVIVSLLREQGSLRQDQPEDAGGFHHVPTSYVLTRLVCGSCASRPGFRTCDP